MAKRFSRNVRLLMNCKALNIQNHTILLLFNLNFGVCSEFNLVLKWRSPWKKDFLEKLTVVDLDRSIPDTITNTVDHCDRKA
jgi:hypothetical protein